MNSDMYYNSISTLYFVLLLLPPFLNLIFLWDCETLLLVWQAQSIGLFLPPQVWERVQAALWRSRATASLGRLSHNLHQQLHCFTVSHVTSWLYPWGFVTVMCQQPTSPQNTTCSWHRSDRVGWEFTFGFKTPEAEFNRRLFKVRSW